MVFQRATSALPRGTDADRRAASHPHERHFARLRRVMGAHRKIEGGAILEEQISQGRPDLSWSPCGNSECSSSTCLDAPIHRYDMYFRRHAKNGASGQDYIWQTIDKLSDVIWPGATSCADKMSRQMILGSFFHSPPLKSAYYQFRDGAGRARIKTDRKSIQAAICQAKPFVEKILVDINLPESHDIICWYLGPAFSEHIGQRTLGDAVVRYMLLCEMWRRYPSERSKPWQFGSPQVLCDLYGGILLSMRTLELFKLVDRFRFLSSSTRNRSWARWMKQFPLCAVMENPYLSDGFIVRSASRPDDVPGRTEATVLEEVGYLGGVGTYTPVVGRKVTRRGADALQFDLL